MKDMCAIIKCMITKKIFFIFILVLAASIASPLGARAESRALFEVRVPMSVGGAVEVRLPSGERREIGRVVMLPTTSRYPSYTASAWADRGSVAASAVNAVHLLLDVKDGKGRTMSLIPRETIAPAAGAGASIVISSTAGTGFFGAWAPPVGTPVVIERRRVLDGGRVIQIEETPLANLGGEIPSEGDVMIFRVQEDDGPYMVDIENTAGGSVIAYDARGHRSIARVVRPVHGCGRFDGTLFQDAGRLRANHTGVIDISTCERGLIGGFQIIPIEHARDSKEMKHAWDLTQWMIVEPLDSAGSTLAAPPLFSSHLVPGPARGEHLWDLWSTYGRRPLVLARVRGGDWTRFPIASGRVDDAFADVTHIRIYFSTTREPLKDMR